MFDSECFNDFMKKVTESDSEGGVHGQVHKVPNACVASFGYLLEQHRQEQVQTMGEKCGEALFRHILNKKGKKKQCKYKKEYYPGASRKFKDSFYYGELRD